MLVEICINPLLERPLIYFSKGNFENKLLLLQAEVHYMGGKFEEATVAHKASIKSAHTHRFLHEGTAAHASCKESLSLKTNCWM